MSASPAAFQRDRRGVNVPLWREAFAGLDWLALRTSPVYFGWGVPRGDKSGVIVVPGFLGTDHYLWEMNLWLRRIGYTAYMSRIGWNAECLNVLTERLAETLDKAYAETGRKAHLIGHSLGGVLARSIALRKAERVASVITLGSPIRGVRSHPLVLGRADDVRNLLLRKRREEWPDCYTGYCTCAAVMALMVPRSEAPLLRQTAIYTKTDGVVDWRVCVSEDPSENFEVEGTHVGLAFNPAVYKLIAQRLAGDKA
jgi:pimeloyl-ACP methyl ester carboxylesterase